MVQMMYRCCLRCVEILGLKMTDIDLGKRPRISVRNTRSAGARVIEIDKTTARELRAWLDIRKEICGITQRTPVFCTIRIPGGRRILSQYIRKMMARISAKSKLKGKPLGARKIRDSGAAGLKRRGYSVKKMQVMFGHAQRKTTDRYLDTIPGTR